MPVGYPGEKRLADEEPWWKKKIQEARKTKVKRSPYRVRDYRRVSRNRTTRKVGEGGVRGRTHEFIGALAGYRAKQGIQYLGDYAPQFGPPAPGRRGLPPGVGTLGPLPPGTGVLGPAQEGMGTTMPRFGPRTATYQGLPSGLSRDPLAGLPDIYQYTVEQMKLWQEYLASLRAGQGDSAGSYYPGYGQSYGGRRYGGGGGGGGTTYEPQPDDYYKNMITWRI